MWHIRLSVFKKAKYFTYTQKKNSVDEPLKSVSTSLCSVQSSSIKSPEQIPEWCCVCTCVGACCSHRDAFPSCSEVKRRLWCRPCAASQQCRVWTSVSSLAVWTSRAADGGPSSSGLRWGGRQVMLRFFASVACRCFSCRLFSNSVGLRSRLGGEVLKLATQVMIMLFNLSYAQLKKNKKNLTLFLKVVQWNKNQPKGYLYIDLKPDFGGGGGFKELQVEKEWVYFKTQLKLCRKISESTLQVNTNMWIILMR